MVCDREVNTKVYDLYSLFFNLICDIGEFWAFEKN